MKNKLSYTFGKHLKEQLKDPEFEKEWIKSETEYQLARTLIKKRKKSKISQRELAKKLHTSQAVISRIETMQGNPSLGLLKRIARALDSEIVVRFK